MIDLYRPGTSGLHRLDARLKLILTLAFILSLSLTPPAAWPAYILYQAAVLSAVLLARIEPALVFRRALAALPFALAAVPLVFAGPEPRQILILIPGLPLTISPAGLERFSSIALKSWISVQAAVLLAGTTRFPDLLSALHRLGIPAVFVAITGLMGRYLSLMVDETACLLRARSSRSAASPVGKRSGGTLAWRAHTAGGMAGSLLLRSIERSGRVHAAMLARGYNGVPPAAETAPLTGRDAALLLLSLGSLALLGLVGLLTGK